MNQLKTKEMIVKTTRFILYLVIAGCLITACNAQGNENEKSKAKQNVEPGNQEIKQKVVKAFEANYLGEEPPGLTPKVFAPDVISTASNEHGCTFSPDGKEFYFTRIINNIPTIMCTKQMNGSWSVPKVVPFSGNHLDRLPQMSPDGTTIYFQSRRPRQKPIPPGEVLMWLTTRTGSDDWAEPNPLAVDLGIRHAGISVTVANNGTMYASGIVRLRPENGKYTKFEKLTPNLKGTYPFIAPDESYIVYCSGKQRDLVVSFHKPDDSWTQPQLILDQQKPYWIQGFPIVSPDGKYLFFTADHDIYWVSAEVIKKNKPKELK